MMVHYDNITFYKVFKLSIEVLSLCFHFAEFHVSPHSKVVIFAINLVATVRETWLIRN
jgi:hypothetical protein